MLKQQNPNKTEGAWSQVILPILEIVWAVITIVSSQDKILLIVRHKVVKMKFAMEIKKQTTGM